MAPVLKPSAKYHMSIRLVLMLNSTVAMSLSYAADRAVFYALGAVFSTSLLVNTFLVIRASCMRRCKRHDEGLVVRPNLFLLALDTLGTTAFLALYIAATIEVTDDYNYNGRLLLKAYASFGALIATMVHGYLALAQFYQYIQYRCSLEDRCPNCNHTLCEPVPGYFFPAEFEGAVDAKLPALPRDSVSDSSAGQNERDNLILNAEA